MSGILGIPVELENLTQTGVEGALKCGPVDSLAASAVGVNVPESNIPFAWAMKKNCQLMLFDRDWETDQVAFLGAFRRCLETPPARPEPSS